MSVPVAHWDKDGRQGAYDLRFVIDGRSVAVEVKRLVNQQFRRATAAADQAGYTLDDRMTRSWHAWLEFSASWKAVRAEIPALLVELEEIDWQGRRPRETQVGRPIVHDSLARLGVVNVFSFDPTEKHPPGFYLMPSPWGGGVPGIDTLPAFVARKLASQDVGKLLQQLAAADADERHAFLFVGWEHMEHICLSRAEQVDLPDTDPALPPPIDGVWLASTEAGSRLIAWLPDGGWVNGVFADG